MAANQQRIGKEIRIIGIIARAAAVISFATFLVSPLLSFMISGGAGMICLMLSFFGFAFTSLYAIGLEEDVLRNEYDWKNRAAIAISMVIEGFIIIFFFILFGVRSALHKLKGPEKKVVVIKSS